MRKWPDGVCSKEAGVSIAKGRSTRTRLLFTTSSFMPWGMTVEHPPSRWPGIGRTADYVLRPPIIFRRMLRGRLHDYPRNTSEPDNFV
jgi:hypothetical protein